MKVNLDSYIKPKVNLSGIILWFAWTLATGIGWVIGWQIVESQFAINIYSKFEGSNVILSNIVADFIHGAFIGIVISLAQWFVIRRWAFRMNKWLLINASVWAVAFALGGATNWFAYYTCQYSWCFNKVDSVAFAAEMFVVGIILGFSLGYIQPLIMQKYTFEARLWLIMSVLGWAVALFAVAGHAMALALIEFPMFADPKVDLFNAVGVLVVHLVGFTYGGITGIALVRFQEKFKLAPSQ